jgi:hypothetical protein
MASASHFGWRHDEIDRLVGIGQKLVMARAFPRRARAVLLARLAGFERAEHAQLALDRWRRPHGRPVTRAVISTL